MKVGDRVRVTRTNVDGALVNTDDIGTVVAVSSPFKDSWDVRMDNPRGNRKARPDGSHWAIREYFLEVLTGADAEPVKPKPPKQGRRVRVAPIEGVVTFSHPDTFSVVADGLPHQKDHVFDMADPQVSWEYVQPAKQDGDVVCVGGDVLLYWRNSCWRAVHNGANVLSSLPTYASADAEHAAGRVVGKFIPA